MKARIRKTIVGFNRRESDRLVLELGNEGILQVGMWDTASIETVAPRYAEFESSITAILLAIENLCSDLNIAADHQTIEASVAENEPIIFQRDLESDRAAIAAIRDEIDELRELRQKYLAENEALRVRLNDARDIAALIDDPERLMRMTLCCHVFGTLQEEIDGPGGGPDGGYYIRHAGRYALGISLRGDRDRLVGFLNKHGFDDKEELLEKYSSTPHLPDELKANAESIKDKLDIKEEDLNRRREEITMKLTALHEIYANLKSSMNAKKEFLQTGDTEFISGWIDIADLARLVSALERACGKSFFLHVFSEDEMRALRAGVPVRLRNRWFFRAFELIVKNAGVPGDRELDPTPVATIAYLLMFGVMFGDIGQGLVLSLTGCIMKIIARRKKLRAFFHDGGTILIAAGLSAALFGVLYGSVFSNERLLPSLWFHPMEHIMDLFFATIMMGAFFISLGLIMNIFNLYKAGEYFEAIFGIHGVLGFIVYTGSLYLSVRYIKAGIPPGNAELLLILALPVGLFMFKNIPGRLFPGQGKMYPHGIFEYFVESFVELMEMFSGFLGNSISFIRAGAFALSHAGLSIAVYTLAGIAGPALSIASLSIIIIGNIFIILLEGLICGIQSMRLEYYEFFSKFFRGNGIEFAPFSFKRKQAVAKGVA